jgi:hypothetical protein
MMVSRPRWCLVVLVTATGLSVTTALMSGFSPGAADLIDPLGRPAALARSITGSTAALDTLAIDIRDKHQRIADTSRTVSAVADHLDHVVAAADVLTPLSTEANTGTAGLAAGLRPLPPLVTALTENAHRATAVSDRLGGSVGTVADRLRTIGDRLAAISGRLSPLTPRARDIAGVLRQLRTDTAPLRPLGPVLGRLGPALGGSGR